MNTHLLGEICAVLGAIGALAGLLFWNRQIKAIREMKQSIRQNPEKRQERQ